MIQAQEKLRAAILAVRALPPSEGLSPVQRRLAEAWDYLEDWTQKTNYVDPPKPRPTIAELDAILNSEQDVPITINADGEITAGRKVAA
jgi:hypothetical protein